MSTGGGVRGGGSLIAHCIRAMVKIYTSSSAWTPNNQMDAGCRMGGTRVHLLQILTRPCKEV